VVHHAGASAVVQYKRELKAEGEREASWLSDGWRGDSGDGGSERVEHEGLPSPFDQQQRGFWMDHQQDCSEQRFCFQPFFSSRSSSWWRWFSLSLSLSLYWLCEDCYVSVGSI